jgi:xanthine dehydrogenase accessory factor
MKSPTELLILGASRIAEELARLGVLLRWPVRVYGPRFDARDYPETASLVEIGAGYRNLEILSGSAVVVASHHKGDPDFIKAALAGEAAYVGLIASQKRAHLVFADLAASGLAPSRLQAVHAPAGLDGGGERPQDIALSVIAEILSCASPLLKEVTT